MASGSRNSDISHVYLIKIIYFLENWLFTAEIHAQSDIYNIIEPGHEKTWLIPYANNKGADQPAHPRSLISAFVFAA